MRPYGWDPGFRASALTQLLGGADLVFGLPPSHCYGRGRDLVFGLPASHCYGARRGRDPVFGLPPSHCSGEGSRSPEVGQRLEYMLS